MTESYGTVEFDFRLQAIHCFDGADFRLGQMIGKDWVINAVKDKARFWAYCNACVEENGIQVIFENGKRLEFLDANHGRLLIVDLLDDEFPPDVPFWRIEELLKI